MWERENRENEKREIREASASASVELEGGAEAAFGV